MHDTAYWNRIRAFYKSNSEAVLASRNRWELDPYAWDHEAGIQMTPIERALWDDIRFEGVVMFPQYPVLSFFVDFANPSAKVAIECDGKAFHLDKDKDAARDRALKAEGWTVYRFTGRECMQDTEVSEDDHGRAIVTLSPVRLEIIRICQIHRISVKRH